MKYALLDYDGQIIRWLSYPATGAILIERGYDELIDICGEAML